MESRDYHQLNCINCQWCPRERVQLCTWGTEISTYHCATRIFRTRDGYVRFVSFLERWRFLDHLAEYLHIWVCIPLSFKRPNILRDEKNGHQQFSQCEGCTGKGTHARPAQWLKFCQWITSSKISIPVQRSTFTFCEWLLIQSGAACCSSWSKWRCRLQNLKEFFSKIRMHVLSQHILSKYFTFYFPNCTIILICLAIVATAVDIAIVRTRV
jgi:hypothetical protein